MTRVLILGAGGMLGHTLLRVLADEPRYETLAHVHNMARIALLAPGARARCVIDGDLAEDGAAERAVERTRPDVVINCVGVLPRTEAGRDPARMHAVNAQLPHRLATACSARGGRLVQISTDCVFSGRGRNYRETDPADAEDAYGQTKHAGEVGAPHLTLRTSMIGPELGASHGLLEWFLRSIGPVLGYTRVRFSGLTTLALARLLADHALIRPDLTGVYHVAAEPITKFELLGVIRSVYGLSTSIMADGRIEIDRTLAGDRFAIATGWNALSWREMLEAMRAFG